MRLLVACLALLGAVAISRADMVFHDDRGRDVVLSQPAQRIISLAPHLTELVFASGAGGKLVGVAEYSDYPEAARQLPVIGNSAALDVEHILTLRPDLVLGWRSGNPPGEIAKLEKLGLRVFVTEPHGLDDIAAQIALLGRVAGTQILADTAAAQLRRDLDSLRQEYQGRRKIRVFYQVWHEPLMTINDKQIIGEVITLCGGENIFGSLGSLVPTVSLEAILAADPDAIVTSSEQPAAEALDGWRKWPQLRAVRNGNLLVIPHDDISRATPRLISGARNLCQQLDHVRREAAAR